MSSNPNFVAMMSTDEIYFGQDLLLCLTEAVDGKADSNHEHDDIYAEINHTHTNYATTTHTHTADDVGAIATDDVATVSEVKTYLNI